MSDKLESKCFSGSRVARVTKVSGMPETFELGRFTGSKGTSVALISDTYELSRLRVTRVSGVVFVCGWGSGRWPTINGR